MDRSAESSRRFWLGVIAAGGSSVLPRSSPQQAPDQQIPDQQVRDQQVRDDVTLDDVTAEVALTVELLAGLRKVAATLAVSLSSVLFAGHAHVLATLCGADDVVAGYVARGATGPLPCRLKTGCRSWRELLAEAFCAESAALTHRGVPVHELLARTDMDGPLFETAFDPTDSDGCVHDSGVALWVGVAARVDGLALRLRCRGDLWDAPMLARVGDDHLRALESLAADADACPPPLPAHELHAESTDNGLTDTELTDTQPTDTDHEAPETDAERRLARTWSALLGLPAARLGRRDHFFDLGGTSMSAVKLAILLDRAVSPRDITEHPTLAELAELADVRAAERARI